MKLDNELNIDPEREGRAVGVPIRAYHPHTQRFDTYDIAELDRASLLRWLDKRVDKERLVLILLRHPPRTAQELVDEFVKLDIDDIQEMSWPQAVDLLMTLNTALGDLRARERRNGHDEED